MRTLTGLVAALALPLALAGCGSPDPRPDDATADGPAVALSPITASEMDAAIASHAGKVVLVDCWFLGCAPCVKKFPHLVEVHEKYKGRGLVVMSLDVIEEEWDSRGKVLDFLKEKKATFPNYIAHNDPKGFSEWKDKYDANATPTYVLFDRSGKWRPVTIEGEKNIEPVLEKLLTE